MTNDDAGRALAAVYGPNLQFHGSIYQADEADLVIDTLVALDLLDATGSEVWRGRIRRLATDPAEPVDVPQEIRAAVLDQSQSVRGARSEDAAFDLVGARGWREKARRRDASASGMRVVRCYPVPVHDDPERGVDVSLVVVYEDGVAVDWYEPRLGPGAPLGTLGGEGIQLRDDAGTAYAQAKDVSLHRGTSEVGHYPMSMLFAPAPPPRATRLDVLCDASVLARVPLT